MTAPTSTRTIAFLTPYVSGVYYGNVLAGASQAAQRRGTRLLVFQESAERLVRSRLAGDQIDGWIVVLDTAGIELIARLGAPIVTISTPTPDLPAVCSDNQGGMYVAVAHLIAHGHRRIAFIGRAANLDIMQRREGYAQALADHDIPLDERLIVDAGDELEPAGRDGARRLLESGAAFTAIVAGTDKNALGVLEVLRASGRRVPEDVALVGFDDVDEARIAEPPLTTVRQRFDSLGGAAVDLLLDRLADRPAASGSINLPTALVVRRSCGCDAGQFLGQPPDDAAAARDWRAALARELVGLLLYPFRPDPRAAPAQAWPGVDTLPDTIAAALEDRALPASAAIEQAWQAGVALTTDLDFLNTALDRLEQAGARQLAAARDAGAAARLAGALRVLRAELLRARVLREAAQVQYLDNIIRANNEIGTALLEDIDAGALPLEWLRHTPATWGCLALWAKAGDQMNLHIGSVYSRHEQLALALGARYRPAAFLAAEALPAPALGQPDIVMLLPLRTARRDWGVLALGGAFETRYTWSGDPIVMWAEMLSAALERGTLLAELKRQQQTLQLAYEREHALTAALREIGSPVIPLMPGVLLVPLIGAIDSSRARQVIAAALEQVRNEHASDLLIDVTGVPVIDTQVASALLQLARMVGLLGSRTVLVGVRPEIAQSIVGLGIDLAGIGTSATLADALRMLRRREAAR
ncbi:MAG TPA: substrate-binding domain-containing protein [Roseiflexaceae bacterium]|nr:substrate-binding domain-containing protein [Roseiflexaceae bacterium]